MAITPHEQTGVTCSKRNYDVANQAYQKYGLLGSPHKDLVDVEEGRVIGAYLNGSDRAAQHGMVTVAAPIAKRLGLAYLSVLWRNFLTLAMRYICAWLEAGCLA